MGLNPYERELSQAQACCFLKTVQLNSNVHDFRLDGPGWWWWTLSWRWDVEYIFPSRERETVARFDDIFDLCSLVRLRFICQIWHIFTSIWAMYPISLGYKLIFDSPQSDWLPIRWIYSNSPSSLSPSSIFAQQFYQLFSFKTFAPSSQSCNSLERAPLPQRSRTKLSWFTSCECTLAPVRLYSAGLPSAGPNNRFPGRRDSLFWSRVLKCGLRSEEGRGVTVRNSLGPVCLDISGEHDTVSCVVQCQTLDTVHYPAPGTPDCLDWRGELFIIAYCCGRKSQNMFIYYTRDCPLDSGDAPMKYSGRMWVILGKLIWMNSDSTFS